VDDLLKIVIVILAAIFPVLVNTMVGRARRQRATSPRPARSMQASERQLLWKVILPATFPFVIVGIKLALGRALTTVIVAEFFVSVSGLGRTAAHGLELVPDGAHVHAGDHPGRHGHRARRGSDLFRTRRVAPLPVVE